MPTFTHTNTHRQRGQDTPIISFLEFCYVRVETEVNTLKFMYVCMYVWGLLQFVSKRRSKSYVCMYVCMYEFLLRSCRNRGQYAVYLCMHVCMYGFCCVCRSEGIDTYIHTYAYTYTHINTYTFIHSPAKCVRTSHTHTHTYIHTHTHSYLLAVLIRQMCTHVTYIHPYIHTHTHTYISIPACGTHPPNVYANLGQTHAATVCLCKAAPHQHRNPVCMYSTYIMHIYMGAPHQQRSPVCMYSTYIMHIYMNIIMHVYISIMHTYIHRKILVKSTQPLCMYVCMYVCMHVWLYHISTVTLCVCMYACIYA